MKFKTATGPRVINRNYLQIQANNYNNRASTLSNQFRSRVGTSQHDINNLNTNNTQFSSGGGVGEPKRTRSISRSVRNLFSKPGKREQSSESSNNVNAINYDVNSGKFNFI